MMGNTVPNEISFFIGSLLEISFYTLPPIYHYIPPHVTPFKPLRTEKEGAKWSSLIVFCISYRPLNVNRHNDKDSLGLTATNNKVPK